MIRLFFRRLFMSLYGFGVMAAALGAAVYAVLRYFLNGDVPLGIVGGAVALAVFFVICTLYLVRPKLSGGPRQLASVSVTNTSQGTVRISISALDSMVKSALGATPGVLDIKTKVYELEDSIGVQIDLTVDEDIRVTDATLMMQRNVKAFLEEHAGIMVKQVNVYVNTVLPKDAAFPFEEVGRLELKDEPKAAPAPEPKPVSEEPFARPEPKAEPYGYAAKPEIPEEAPIFKDEAEQGEARQRRFSWPWKGRKEALPVQDFPPDEIDAVIAQNAQSAAAQAEDSLEDNPLGGDGNAFEGGAASDWAAEGGEWERDDSQWEADLSDEAASLHGDNPYAEVETPDFEAPQAVAEDAEDSSIEPKQYEGDSPEL